MLDMVNVDTDNFDITVTAKATDSEADGEVATPTTDDIAETIATISVDVEHMAGFGDDTIIGGAGDDYIEGNDGDDQLRGDDRRHEHHSSASAGGSGHGGQPALPQGSLSLGIA